MSRLHVRAYSCGKLASIVICAGSDSVDRITSSSLSGVGEGTGVGGPMMLA